MISSVIELLHKGITVALAAFPLTCLLGIDNYILVDIMNANV